MRTRYFRELSYHSVASLSRLLGLDDDGTRRLVGRLCACGVLKPQGGGDDEYYASSSEDRGKYQFTYVGIALVDEFCLIVYPKYLPPADPREANGETKDAMRQVLRVLRKSGRDNAQLVTPDEQENRPDDRPALMIALLELYGEYGVYSNYIRTLADNGNGSINWERTINNKLPFIKRGRPIYVEYRSDESDRDASDFVTRLHRCVLTKCSAFMRESGLAELLSLNEVWLSDDEIEDFGDPEYITYRLERERGVQFITWKQSVIDLLIRLVKGDGSSSSPDTPLCFGTSSFYHEWELACKTAFGDVLGERIGDLGVDLKGEWVSRKGETLLDIIPRPQWSLPDGTLCGDVETLIPDTVMLTQDSGGRSIFAILDAKYYTPVIGKTVSGVPGVESVTKQFLYQAAYRKFIVDHGFESVANVFVSPTSGDDIRFLGRVAFLGVMPEERPPFTNSIAMFLVPAGRVFDAYLSDSMLEDAMLHSLIGCSLDDITI